jgi:hypothetical protein
MVEKVDYKILSKLNLPPLYSEMPTIMSLTTLSPLVKSSIQNTTANERERSEREEISTIIIKGNQIQGDILTNSHRNTLGQIEDKRTMVIDQGDRMQEALRGATKGIDPGADHMINILRASQDIILDQLMQKRLAFLQRIEPGQKFVSLNQLEKFQNCGSLFVKVNGISIEDIATKDKIDPLEYYKAVRQATRTFLKKDYHEIMKQNEDNSIMTNYPAAAKETTRLACIQMAVLSFEDLSLFKKVKVPTGNSIVNQQILSGAETLIGKTLEMRKKLCKELLISPSLQKEVSVDLEGDYEMKELALMQLGLSIESEEIETYRIAKRLVNEKKGNFAFFDRLIRAIKEYAQHPDQKDSGVLTENDIKHLLTNTLFPNEKLTIGFTDLDRIVDSLPKIPIEKRCNLNICDVNFGNFKKPETIAITHVGKGKFLVELVLDSKEPKGHYFSFLINPKGKHIEWAFLDEFDDPKMKDMRDATMLLTQSVLSFLQKQLINEEHVAHPLEMKPVYIAPKSKGEKAHLVRPKEAKTKPEKPLTPFKRAFEETIVSSEKGVKRIVEIPDECPKNLTLQQWKKLSEKLKKFNTNNKKGSFKRLVGTKKPLSRVRVEEEFRTIVAEDQTIVDARAKHYKFIGVIKRNDEYKEIS